MDEPPSNPAVLYTPDSGSRLRVGEPESFSASSGFTPQANSMCPGQYEPEGTGDDFEIADPLQRAITSEGWNSAGLLNVA
jgi:hypothetical protein